MTALSKILFGNGHGGFAFWCPGCHEAHTVRTGEGPGPRWTFNGDTERPTFFPSILVTSGHYTPGHEGGECWCNYKERTGEDPDFECSRCHSFVTDGRIKFLPDCTHAYTGQTVALPAWRMGD